MFRFPAPPPPPPVMLPDSDLHGQITVISGHTSILMSQTKHLEQLPRARPQTTGTKCRDLHLFPPALHFERKMASGEPELLPRTQLDHQHYTRRVSGFLQQLWPNDNSKVLAELANWIFDLRGWFGSPDFGFFSLTMSSRETLPGWRVGQIVFLRVRVSNNLYE